jgi:hypothetical protein
MISRLLDWLKGNTMSQSVLRKLYCNNCGVQKLEFEPGLSMTQMDCPKCGKVWALGPELPIVPDTVTNLFDPNPPELEKEVTLIEETIRPEVQALIERGRVHADEIPTGLNLTEASALVPVLVNSALGLRINRVRAKRVVLFEEGEDPILSPHALYVMADEAARRIQHQPKQLWPNLRNPELAQRIFDSVAEQGSRPEVARTYEQALRQLSHEAARRLWRMC